jgi:Icc protein
MDMKRMYGKNNLVKTKPKTARQAQVQTSVRLIQISDTHLYAEQDGHLLGVNTHQSFSSVLQQVKKEKTIPNAYIFSGDLSHDGSKASYQHLADVMDSLPAPVFVCPGNHDQPKTFKQLYTSEKCCKESAFLCKRWQVILLDTQIPGKVSGHLSSRELKFLEERLTDYSKYYSLIFFHHHPVPVGAHWLDPLGLNNSDEFFALIDRFPNVRGIVFGHVHQDFAGKHKHISVFGTPSTSVQFKPNTHQFKVDKIQPGYRILSLDDYGVIHSTVQRATRDRSYLTADGNSYGYK